MADNTSEARFGVLPMRVAQALSVMLHPLLMPTYGAATLLTLVPEFAHLDANGIQAVVVFIALVTCLLPALLIALMRLLGIVSSITLFNARERTLPLLVTLLIYGAAGYMIWKYLPGLHNLHVLLLVVTLNIALCGIITPYYKISAHAIGVAGLTGSLLAAAVAFNTPTLFIPLLAAIVLAGLTCSSRLLLNAHTPGQVAAGVLSGFSTAFCAVFFFA